MQTEGQPQEALPDLPKLEVTCSSTQCEHDLHYFGAAKRKSSKYPVGRCKDCGADLVDWSRVHRRAVEDVEYTFEMLRREYWRHEWFHRRIDQHARNHAMRKGRLLLREACRSHLSKHIGSAKPFRDGAQTRTDKNILCYAQHATATCCRKCVEYWHGIPQGEPLEPSQLDYLCELVMLYVSERMPDLEDNPKEVPPIRRRTKS